MKKKALITLLVLVVLVGTLSIIMSAAQSRSRKALAAYKAQLRAQGEALTFEEAGYPFPLETNANLEDFVILADRLRGKSVIPGTIQLMHFTSPGQAAVSWAGGRLVPTNAQAAAAGQFTWERLSEDMQSAAAILADLRSELEHPPRHFGWNYTNPFNATIRNPFVQKRVVAQFLSADTLAALHGHELPRAQADLHALTQLAQVHHGDLTLVSAMIRVAISGLGLTTTWEALQAEGWDEDGLLRLQRDWEGLDLIQALETGLVGERIFGGQAFELTQQTNLNAQVGMLSLRTRTRSGFSGWRDRLTSGAMMVYWRGHAEEDALLYLQQSQARVENLRRLRTNSPGVAVLRESRSQARQFEELLDEPTSRLRYLFTAAAMPNSNRSFETAIRSETPRRMTITVIALKRFHLRQGRYPASLAELVPAFLAAELIDPWSGKPFHYQLHQDGGFTLYSVGEDGRDDGGDPTSTGDKTPFEMWMGKDVVWPKPVFSAATVDK
jgi:hypothetical protein